jgi:REP element-mobilizing transposase RayT
MKTYNQNLYHIIIASNGAKKFLTRVNQDILYNYIKSMLYSKKCQPHTVSGNSEHVHVLLSISPDTSIQQIIREVQQNSLDFLRRESSVFPEFNGWDSNYIAISFHFSQIEDFSNHLINHFDYHRKVTYAEELELLIDSNQE